MIRGALILAVGFSLGYAKAVSEMDDIRENVAKMTTELKEFFKEKEAEIGEPAVPEEPIRGENPEGDTIQ